MATPPAGATTMRGRGAGVEAAASRHLVAAGLRPLAANAFARFGELDLVMLEGDTLVFVEVRYRASERYGGAAASVDARKQRRLVLAARQFLAAHPRYAQGPCRFDVVAASGDPAAPTLTWIRDAFAADDA